MSKAPKRTAESKREAAVPARPEAERSGGQPAVRRPASVTARRYAILPLDAAAPTDGIH